MLPPSRPRGLSLTLSRLQQLAAMFVETVLFSAIGTIRGIA
jgi:hypothetical protein